MRVLGVLKSYSTDSPENIYFYFHEATMNVDTMRYYTFEARSSGCLKDKYHRRINSFVAKVGQVV